MKKILCTLASVLIAAISLNAIDRDHILKVYNWADYIDEDLITEFEQWYEEQTGEPVKIIYQLFDVNEVMLSKIEKGHDDYDVVCPSEYIIERMLRNDLLLPIDRDFGSTPDYTVNVSPFMTNYMNLVEGNGKNANDYSIPYMWGTVGVMYNSDYVTAEEVSNWKNLQDPKYAGNILMKNAFRDIYTSLNIALNSDRIDAGEVTVNELCSEVTEESIARVEEYLLGMKENIAGFEEDFGKEMMAKGKTWINVSWSGDAQWAIEEGSKVGVNLGYEIPAEGSIVWFDGWVIPKYAKNVKAARYFINFMCKPENAVRNMDVIGYVSAIGCDEVLEAMTDSTYAAHDVSYFFGENATSACVNPIMYPALSAGGHYGMMHDLGSEELLEMWSRVKGDNANTTTFILLGVVAIAIVVAIVVAPKKKKRRHARR